MLRLTPCTLTRLLDITSQSLPHPNAIEYHWKTFEEQYHLKKNDELTINIKIVPSLINHTDFF